jgi:hypothetical protein
MNRSLSEALLLKKLLDKEIMPISNFGKNKQLINRLEELEVIFVFSNIGKRGKSVRRGKYFDRYVKSHYNDNLQNFIDIDNRGELIDKFGEDKIKTVNPQTGIYLWSDDNVDIGNNNIISSKIDTALFVHHTKKIEIDRDVLVVGIENFETLVKAINIKHFFKEYKQIVFMFRNSSFLKFIKSSKNRIVYFPDFDIYGVRIYETEILKYNKTTTLFIPKSFELDLNKKGDRKRYFEDLNSKGGKYEAFTKRGQFILNMNEKYQKILSQEFYQNIA